MVGKLRHLIMACAIALAVAACTAPSGNGYIDFTPADDTALAGVVQLPGTGNTEEPRAVAALESVGVNPIDYIDTGGTVTDQGNAVQLDCAVGSCSWAMYSFEIQDRDMQALRLQLGFSAAEECWVGVGNFDSGRWQWQKLSGAGPHSRSLIQSANEFQSPLGRLYFIVLAYDDNDVTVSDLQIDHDVQVAAPTYIADIAPLLNGSTGEKSCTGCHGGISPNLETYTAVKNNANAVMASVKQSSGWMPPNGSQWSQANQDLFQAWIDAGKPES